MAELSIFTYRNSIAGFFVSILCKTEKTKTKSGKRKLKSTGNVEPSTVQNVTIRKYTRHVTPRKAFIKLSVTMLLIRSLNRVIILIFNLENIYYFPSCNGATISLHHSSSLLSLIPVRHLETRGRDSHTTTTMLYLL